jgi:sulfatase maturation enzyme AslB (radical SAM superfamily)
MHDIKEIFNHPFIVEARDFFYGGEYDKVCRPTCPFYRNGGAKNHFLRNFSSGAHLRNSALSPDQRENLKRLALHIKNKDSVLDAVPFQIAIILEGLGCNIECNYCAHVLNTKFYAANYSDRIKDMKRHSERLIESLGDIAKFVYTISFGGSEPLIYSEFDRMCDFLLDYPEVKFSVGTNGLLINEKRAQRIMKQNFTWVRISVDAATKETYQLIRKKGKWGDLMAVVNRLIYLRRKNRKRFPKIQLSFLITNDNYREIVEFAHLAHRLRCDGVHYKMLIRDEVPFQQKRHIAEYKEFGDRLISMDPLMHEDICSDILERREEVDSLTKRYKLNMPRDSVRPAILAKYPELKR